MGRKKRSWADAACGAGAGAIAKTVTAPLERVKLVLQNQELSVGARQWRGLTHALFHIPRAEGGLKALWRGNGINVLRVVPTYAIRFGLYPQCEAALPAALPGDVRRLLAGALSGIGALLVTYPLDTIRTRIGSAAHGHTADGHAYGGVLHCLTDTVRSQGLRGLYAGLGVSVLEIAPYTAVSFAGYEGAKSRMLAVRAAMGEEQARKANAWLQTVRLFSGWLSGVCATLVCYPLDTVRRQLMLDGARGFESRYGRNAATCARMLWQDGGLLRFYHGCSATLLKSAPAVAITFWSKDFLKDLIVKPD
eukprot:TRINITY_DN36772_c0_g1_i1.p1 TRINITY_DN36772_c0_g1~~TRINITY_DN36772_c0_g1_i1.p1  ORF type:complete len:307 (+),score=47.40 TRINITY_DN36772_c0_g1_i1:89-1009(+)